jgi:hypothetical protein
LRTSVKIQAFHPPPTPPPLSSPKGKEIWSASWSPDIRLWGSSFPKLLCSCCIGVDSTSREIISYPNICNAIVDTWVILDTVRLNKNPFTNKLLPKFQRTWGSFGAAISAQSRSPKEMICFFFFFLNRSSNKQFGNFQSSNVAMSKQPNHQQNIFGMIFYLATEKECIKQKVGPEFHDFCCSCVVSGLNKALSKYQMFPFFERICFLRRWMAGGGGL